MAAGLAQALDYLEGLRFTPGEIAWLRTVPALAAAPSGSLTKYCRHFVSRATSGRWTRARSPSRTSRSCA
jgi:nicotinic acid phosphoribosyltransferase